MQKGRMDMKQTRKALGLTQSELGEKLGVDGSIISKMESGTVPIGPRTVLALEALLTRAGIKQ
jgi:predicted transcriptional regulator